MVQSTRLRLRDQMNLLRNELDQIPLASPSPQGCCGGHKHCDCTSRRADSKTTSVLSAHLHRVVVPRQSNRIRTIHPVAMQFATEMLRHCVTRSHRSQN